MTGISRELVTLSEEALRLRAAMAGQRMKWPVEFRQKVLALWSGGIPRQEIVQATGIKPYSLYNWRRKGQGDDASGFTELKLVSFRQKAGAPLVRTCRGSEIAGLSLSELQLFLREGLL